MKYCSLMFVYAIKSIDSVNIKFYVKMQLSYCGESNKLIVYVMHPSDGEVK